MIAIKPIQVANEFIARHGQTGDIDHLKLQKLLYLANGWWIAAKGEPLFDERPEVWRYGPVFSPIYRAFSGAGRAPLTKLRGAGPFGGDAPRVPNNPESQPVLQLVDWIWDEYGGLSGVALSDLTHDIGTPWRTIAQANNYSVPMGMQIPADDDREYFSSLALERGVAIQGP